MCAPDVTHTLTKFTRNYLRFSQLPCITLLVKRVVLLPPKSRSLFAIIAIASSYVTGKLMVLIPPKGRLLFAIIAIASSYAIGKIKVLNPPKGRLLFAIIAIASSFAIGKRVNLFPPKGQLEFYQSCTCGFQSE